MTPPAPTRAAGLAQLADFVPRAGRAYAEGRNTDRGPGAETAVSGLSPYIRHRMVTEAEVLRAVLARHPAQAAEKFIQEVFWRSYWKGWLELRPSVWAEYRRAVDGALGAVAKDRGLRRRYEDAVAGDTGIGCFDAWARELVETNTLHNHTRMWFASIWCFTLDLPWALGADFFLRHLLDGDAASNTLSWRWVLGAQTRGKHYVATAENIARYTGGRFDPAGQLNEAPLPVLLAEPPPPSALVPPERVRGRVSLLLHEDDLGLEAADLDVGEVGAVAVLTVPAARSPLGCAAAVAAWSGAAAADAASRWPGAVVLRAADVADWVAAQARVVVPYAPVGWVAEVLAPFAPARVLRPYDAACWPLATKGFFAFREKIPRLLATLG